MKPPLIFFLSIHLITCSIKPSKVEQKDVIEVAMDVAYYDSIKAIHRDFIDIITIEAIMKPTNGVNNYRVFQSLVAESLMKDTLSVRADASYWSYPDSTLFKDTRFLYHHDISIKDIDTTRLSYRVIDDVMWVMIPSRDTLGASWSKYDVYTGIWLWKVPANGVTVGFLVSMDKIRNHFISYQMYNPDRRIPLDYVTAHVDSVHVEKMFAEIKEILTDYCRKIQN